MTLWESLTPEDDLPPYFIGEDADQLGLDGY
jgi:hypothetical protein